MEDSIDNLGELRERLSDLKTMDHSEHWLSFQASVLDRMKEIQAKVNDLEVTGSKLEEYRVSLRCLTEIHSGELIRGFVAQLQTRVTVVEKADEEMRDKLGVKES